jgi:2-polyprenyl-3-methyl-5-hydroxy-6-metoxy-1,4-benzoquinol methylase
MKNPEVFATFYNYETLGFDLKLVEYGFKTYKKYFKGNSALELGPASGYMTKHLVQEFDKLTVVEGAKSLIEQIPNYSNLIKVNSLFEEYEPKEYYDTIIMNHVLEHIENPIALLKRIYNWLANDGVFIVGVPNAKSFHRLVAVEMGLLKTEYELNNRDIELGHYRVYDFDLLKEHVLEANFKIVKEGGIFLKFLSNTQIEQYLNDSIISAYFKLAEDFYYNSAEIYLVLKKCSNSSTSRK